MNLAVRLIIALLVGVFAVKLCPAEIFAAIAPLIVIFGSLALGVGTIILLLLLRDIRRETENENGDR